MCKIIRSELQLRSLRLLAALLCASSLIPALSSGSAARGMASEHGRDSAMLPSASTHQRLELSIGDKVKINVFERLGGREDEAARNSNLIERVEMAGDYTVQADGNLYLPLLGAQSVHGKTVTEAMGLIETAFQDAFGKQGRISIALVSRSPISVVGRVARPGTFEYTGGMTILHALAQAGGLERPEQGDLYDSVREQRKVEEARDKQKRIVARLETLVAERTGIPAKPSAKLLELAGDHDALALMADQRNLRDLTNEARQIRLKSLDATIAAATREIAIQRGKMEKMQDYSSAKEQRVAVLQQLASKGNGGSYQMLQAKSEFGDFQERLSEVQAVISQVEERLMQAQNEKSRIITESQLELERDIATAEEQAAEVAHQAATSAQLVLLARQASRGRTASPEDVQYVIVRMTPDGPRSIPADETMPLMPGDLVKVQQPGQAPYGAAALQMPTD